MRFQGIVCLKIGTALLYELTQLHMSWQQLKFSQ